MPVLEGGGLRERRNAHTGGPFFVFWEMHTLVGVFSGGTSGCVQRHHRRSFELLAAPMTFWPGRRGQRSSRGSRFEDRPAPTRRASRGRRRGLRDQGARLGEGARPRRPWQPSRSPYRTASTGAVRDASFELPPRADVPGLQRHGPTPPTGQAHPAGGGPPKPRRGAGGRVPQAKPPSRPTARAAPNPLLSNERLLPGGVPNGCRRGAALLSSSHHRRPL